MVHGANLAEVAALVGDPARANMLLALMDGQALTAGELAYFAHVTAPTASAHLAKLVEANLLAVAAQGRHRYFRLASPFVARMLEGISVVSTLRPRGRYRPPSARDEALCLARTCYDHLAGRLGVAIADAMAAHSYVLLDDDGGEVTQSGAIFLEGMGIDLATLRRRRGRAFCRPCLDWSERRPHLAGALGNAIAARLLETRWIERVRDSRAVAITAKGRAGLRERLGIELPAEPLPTRGRHRAAGAWEPATAPVRTR
ncbi:MAG: transcriptional regulator [Alphaproteobacteria bacterium]|nr:MAG: transcriptional regulator [Alphaproteobacteria bacterium]